MIRFNCPHCGRLFELPPALARLPLVCKGCGQPVTVPEQSTIPEPEPRPVEPPRPVAVKPEPRLAPPPMVAPPPATAESLPGELPEPLQEPDDARDELFEKPGVLAELDHGTGERPPAEKTAVPQLATPPAVVKAAPTGDRKSLGILVDVAVALALLFAGVICGELLAKQPTREVLTDAGSAAKFPPVELLLWMSPTLVFLLVYALLASRGRSVGGWLRRRATR